MLNFLSPSQKRKIRKFLSFRYKNKVKKKFTIISNNCWGGMQYDLLGLQYTSPTIGLLFFNNEFYLTFLENLCLYLEKEPKLITNRQIIINEHLGNYWVSLGDVEFCFLHYLSGEDGIQKWQKRKKRICWENIIVKWWDPRISDINLKNSMIERFSRLPYKKILFTASKELAQKYDFCVLINSPANLNGFVEPNDELKLSRKSKITRLLINLINR